MCVLICKNIRAEGPGTIEEFLLQKGTRHQIIDLSSGEVIPDVKDFQTLVLLGGPMSVNDEATYPYITAEIALVREFIKTDKRVLGICLGAQILAKALGAAVYPGSEKEIGWLNIELTVDGAMDYPFRKLATHPLGGDVWKQFKVFHWHGETFDIPSGSVRLASSELYRNQGFRFGRYAYGFQFHIEVTRDMVYEWLKDESMDQGALRLETEKLYEVYRGRAWQFYESFFKVVCEEMPPL